MSYSKPAVTPAWGETNTTSADMVRPTDGQIAAGWPLSSTPPSRQRFNWILNFLANAIRYFMQRGLVDYDAAETYAIGARVIGNDNNTYTSLVNGNIGNTPSSSPGQWQPWALTLGQINASQLTQGTAAPGDSSTKVANTNFVTSAIASIYATLSSSISSLAATVSSLAAAISGLSGSVSLGARGWIQMPSWAGGLMIQWGSDTMYSGTSSFSYPTAFPTSVFMGVCSLYNGNQSNIHRLGFNVVDNSSFNIICDNSSVGSSPYVSWIAIGY